jgi:hypothetical protein
MSTQDAGGPASSSAIINIGRNLVTAVNGLSQAFITGAPTIGDSAHDGTTYGRINGLWGRVVNIAGDTMTGVLALVGTSTNDNAAAGQVGELVQANLAYGSGPPLTSGTSVNATSISLTAGDWEVSGAVVFTAAGTTTINSLQCCITTTSATIVTTDISAFGDFSLGNTVAMSAGGGGSIVRCGPTRLSLASTTTVFLVALATFGTSTCQLFGWNLRARRVR